MTKKTKKERKRSKMGWLIALIVVAVLGVGGVIGWQYIAKEHKEAMSLPLNAVDFSNLADGVYTGEYEGGMYKWRNNKAEVTVEGGKVTGIKLVESKFGEDPAKYVDPLYVQVVDEQTLQVDAVSGSTLTSKAALQAVENAHCCRRWINQNLPQKLKLLPSGRWGVKSLTSYFAIILFPGVRKENALTAAK